MERRNKSLKILNELNYIDSLDSFDKADALVAWYNDHFTNNKIEDLDLELSDLLRLEELFFRNIQFLKQHQETVRLELNKIKKMKSFLKN
ncbi:hypothetical protein ACNSOP_05190 [Aliarcobacter lanthieri]|uniref:hypothetical protein n=1 Tax=Arcobacteraceae TaxID=2808963 RepID=UPI000DE870AE|nr:MULTISPECIES: hypothetical protein [Arcobacteraceae]MBL3520355.1 hypothetical protein [Aliarcobacter lanthieri]RBQ27281.1 hypothetical protein CRU88_01070 [Arcobacter sp. CECT 9188]